MTSPRRATKELGKANGPPDRWEGENNVLERREKKKAKK